MVLQTCSENMLPNTEEFGKCFHELFKQPSDNQRFEFTQPQNIYNNFRNFLQETHRMEETQKEEF